MARPVCHRPESLRPGPPFESEGAGVLRGAAARSGRGGRPGGAADQVRGSRPIRYGAGGRSGPGGGGDPGGHLVDRPDAVDHPPAVRVGRRPGRRSLRPPGRKSRPPRPRSGRRRRARRSRAAGGSPALIRQEHDPVGLEAGRGPGRQLRPARPGRAPGRSPGRRGSTRRSGRRPRRARRPAPGSMTSATCWARAASRSRASARAVERREGGVEEQGPDPFAGRGAAGLPGEDGARARRPGGRPGWTCRVPSPPSKTMNRPRGSARRSACRSAGAAFLRRRRPSRPPPPSWPRRPSWPSGRLLGRPAPSWPPPPSSPVAGPAFLAAPARLGRPWRFFTGGPAARRSASSSAARSGVMPVDRVALAQRGVGLAVGHVGTEAALLEQDRRRRSPGRPRARAAAARPRPGPGGSWAGRRRPAASSGSR